MYFDENRFPRAYTIAVPFMIGMALFAWAKTRPQVTTSVWVALAIAAGFGVWFLINFVERIALVIGDERRKGREVEFRFSPNHLAETIAQMNADQLKAIRAGRSIIEIVPTERGPVQKLGGTSAYMYTVWFILKNSNQFNVHPVNRFMTGTYHFDVLGDQAVDDQGQAKSFHQWLWLNGIAEWGVGNTSMSWKEGWGPERVMKVLGLESDTYDD